jgi:hypothetical protein
VEVGVLGGFLEGQKGSISYNTDYWIRSRTLGIVLYSTVCEQYEVL